MLGNFSAHILVSAIGGFILSFPWTFNQIWRFIRPGLHGKEASAARGVTWAATVLFFLGVCFGYFVIAPLSLQFLGHYEIGDVKARIALMSYLKTVASITLAAGLIFQVPVVVHFLAKLGLVTPAVSSKVPQAHVGGHAHHRGHHHASRPHEPSAGRSARTGTL